MYSLGAAVDHSSWPWKSKAMTFPRSSLAGVPARAGGREDDLAGRKADGNIELGAHRRIATAAPAVPLTSNSNHPLAARIQEDDPTLGARLGHPVEQTLRRDRGRVDPR
jgi:hypothetical protein